MRLYNSQDRLESRCVFQFAQRLFNAGAGYSITTNSAVPGNSLLGVGNNAQGYCTYDYLGIRSATDSTSGLMGDRFCGEQLNTARAPNGADSSIQLCCKLNANIILFI
jgi:hypothetical protein